jgi:hypothetical protein
MNMWWDPFGRFSQVIVSVLRTGIVVLWYGRLGHTKKCCVSANVVEKKNRVDRSELNFFFFLILFPIQVNTLQIQTQLWEYSLNWTKALFPKSICTHAEVCPYLCTGCKYKDVFYIFGTN